MRFLKNILYISLLLNPLFGLSAYNLTVNNGSGDGSYTEATTAEITADSPAAGFHFVNWTTADGGSFADANSPKTTYTMPGNDAVVTANYINYSAFIVDQNTKLVASDASASDEFGYAVAISGDTAVIGAYRDEVAGNEAGAAYVFIKIGGVWVQQQKLQSSDIAAFDNFGISVAISGDTIAIGANSDDDGGTDTGSVYVFTRSTGVWTQRTKLNASDAAASDFFGKSLSISGNTIAVGANGAEIGGAAYVFTGSNATWTEQKKLTASDAASEDDFGQSIALSGDTLLVGAHADDDAGTSSGSAYVFTRSGTTWTQQQKLTAADADENDQFGFSVGLSGNTIVVGSRFDSDSGRSSGSAYIFTRSGTTWNQQAKLTADDAATDDQFGVAVNICNDTVIVGASGNDDTAEGSGSAYIFLRNGTTWAQQEKINASDPAENDAFGCAVAVDLYNVIVGAVFDAGGGSAYTFDLTPAYTLTVTNGTGDGKYLDTNVVPVVAVNFDPVAYHFVNWTTSDGGTIANADVESTNYTMPANDVELTANFEINTYTVTYNAGANGAITGTTPQTIDHGSDASQVTATPDTGYYFVNWSDGSTDNPRTDTNITADLTVTANFAIITYDLLYVADAGGTITGDALQTVEHGSDGTKVTAVPRPGYYFVNWSDGLLTAARTDTNVTQDMTVSANFAENPSYSLTVVDGAGSGNYAEGSINDIVADTRKDNKVFKNWSTSDGGTIADPKSTTTTYTMPANNATVTANFVEGYILTVNFGTGSGGYETGTVVTVIADATAPGMLFDKWTGDVANVADVNSSITTITITDSDVEITATYAVDPATATSITIGSMLQLRANDIEGMTTEFTNRPKVYGIYTDPSNSNEKNSSTKSINKIKSNQQSDISKNEWARSVYLYDKNGLKEANKNGDTTAFWLTNNPISKLDNVLWLKTKTKTGRKLENIIRGTQICPPQVNGVSPWDNGETGAGFHSQSKIIISGKFFGSKLPQIGIEYTDPKTGSIKLKRLKVLKTMNYADAKGDNNKSVMDVDETSASYGESAAYVELPKKWWNGWTAGNYDIVVDNKIGIDTFSITTLDSSSNTAPVANDDNYNLQVGTSSYYLDVTENDEDAESDSVTIILDDKQTALGGKVSVSKGQIRYSPPKDETAPINDSFTYQLDDGHGGISGTASVSVNFEAISITSVEGWDENALNSVQEESIIVLKGQNFGLKAPTVTISYSSDRSYSETETESFNLNLKVQKNPQYEDYRGKENSSYTDLTTGASEIKVEMPRTWWEGWTAGDYTITVDNGISAATTTVTTETGNNTAPVAENDSFTFFSGESDYSLDVLANDTDAESDQVSIVLSEKTSNYGSKISVDKKTNTIKYYREKDILCNFENDSFTYYLIDSKGAKSNNATVIVNGSLNP